MNKRQTTLRVIILTLLLLNCACASNAASRKKNKDVSAPASQNEESQKESGGSTKLSGSVKNKTPFYKIDESVLADVEKGSPAAIKSAMARFKKTESEYTDNDKILIALCAQIMEIVWPSVPVDFPVYAATTDNPYLGAVNSAKNGVFDSSTGNIDFLSTLLSSFVLFYTKPQEAVLKQCETSILAALKIKPDSVLGNYVAGYYYEQIQNYQKAEDYYKKAYNASKDTTEISLAYAKVLNRNGNPELASTIISTISGNSVNDIQVLKQNAYIAYEKDDLQSAEEYVARVLQQTPNDLDFVLFRAKIFIKKNDYIHAVSLLDMYARQNDTNLDYLILRANVQLDWSKNTSAATETVEKALKLYPESEDALLLAAKLSSTTDSPVGGKYADELAQLVLAKNPQNTQALSYALEGLMLRENWESAYDISSDLITKSDADTKNVFNHVTICIKMGKKNEAFEVANQWYSKNKNDEKITQAYVYAYSQVNSRDSSLALIDSLMTNANSKMKSYLLYRRSYLQRTDDAQLADLRSSLIANPRNSDALFRLYEIYYDKKDYRKAQYYLKQVVAINPNDSSFKKLNEALTQLIK